MIPKHQRPWFEKTVKPELHRLSRNGHAPGHHRWDGLRAFGLPTMYTLLKRLELRDSAQLAQAAGLKPPNAGAMNRGTKRPRSFPAVPQHARRNRGDDDEDRGLPATHITGRTCVTQRDVQPDGTVTVTVRTRTAYMLR